MEFIYHVQNNTINKLDKETLDQLRRIMTNFEMMVNTVIPKVRVHLREKI